MNTDSLRGRKFTFSIAGFIAHASLVVVLAASGLSESHAAGDHMSSAP